MTGGLAELGCLAECAVDAGFMAAVPHHFAREHLVLVLVHPEGERGLVCAQGTPPWVAHNVMVVLGSTLSVTHEEPEALASMIDDAYGSLPSDEAVDGVEGSLDSVLEMIESDILTSSGKSDASRFLDRVLFDAIRAGVSDVHIHPLEQRTLLRRRIDGVLSDSAEIGGDLGVAVVSRLKVLSGMDTSETRSPQDGRATVRLGREGDAARRVDLRVSTIPTAHGERAVVRILDDEAGRSHADLESIGMPEAVRRRYDALVHRPNGMVLLTGPTGSGKTTTLYATLRSIAGAASEGGVIGGAQLNIMTVEDPVEYRLTRHGITISQSQVNTKKGMSFSSGLRHILRQDPDVVMVGEIRDLETAQIAIQASLTGHLVFSTLHTNDSVGAPPRLVDLGCEPYLVASALTGVMAQRLVRLVHERCGGDGCEGCLGTGYRGRTGIFELFVVGEDARELVSSSARAAELRACARASGMGTLRESGLALVRSGRTTRAEIERVTVDLVRESAGGC